MANISPRALTRTISTTVRGIDPRLSCRFIAAEDESVDDEVKLLLDGRDTDVQIQLGYGYAAVNLWIEGEQAVELLYLGDNVAAAAKVAAKAVLQ